MLLVSQEWKPSWSSEPMINLHVIKEDAKDLPVGDKSGLEHSATRNGLGMANCR